MYTIEKYLDTWKWQDYKRTHLVIEHVKSSFKFSRETKPQKNTFDKELMFSGRINIINLSCSFFHQKKRRIFLN